MDDGKRLGVYAERLGVALHCAPARPPEDRRWGGGRTPSAHAFSVREAECLGEFSGSFFTFVCVFFVLLFVC